MNEIPMTPTPGSSNIHSVGYDAETMTLAVCFLRKGQAGDVYHYQDVPATTYTSMLQAPSVGKYFVSYVKGVFQSRKVTE